MTTTAELFELVKQTCIEEGIRTRVAGDHHLFLGHYKAGYDPRESWLQQVLFASEAFGKPEDFKLEYFGAWKKLPQAHVEIRSPRTGLFIQDKEGEYFIRPIFDGHLDSVDMSQPSPNIEADGITEELAYKIERLETQWWELLRHKLGI